MKKEHIETPRRTKYKKPKRIFGTDNETNRENKNKSEKVELKYRDRNLKNKINMEIEKMNLEILLLNTLTITALKVQTVINKFLEDKPYTSIFCFTETKVDCINFIPVGLKIITKQRKKKEKKGGGLAIGYINDGKTKLEEIKVDHSDVLVVEGTTRGNKIRMILTYMGCSKNKTGKEYE